MSNLNKKAIQYLTTKYNMANLDETSLQNFFNEVEEISARIPRKERLKHDFLHLTGTTGWEQRVNFYNQVVKNVTSKIGNYVENVIVPDNAKVVGLKNEATGKMYLLSDLTLDNFPEIDDKTVVVFSYEVAVMSQNYRFKNQSPVISKKHISVPYIFFRNDPITVAVHIRNLVTEQIDKNVKLDVTESSKRVDELRNQLERAEQMVQENVVRSEKISALNEAKQARKAKRLEKKTAITV